MQVESRQRFAPRHDLCCTCQRAHHVLQRPLYLKNDAGAARRDQRNVAAELQCIAEALFGVQQNGLALKLV